VRYAVSKMPTEPGQQRSPTDTDRRIARRIRERRLSLNLRQEDLAKALDITQRQFQKYETGINRISAARLVNCARALNVHVSWFYQGEADTTKMAARLSDEESALIDRYRSLSGRSRKALLDIALVLDREVKRSRRD